MSIKSITKKGLATALAFSMVVALAPAANADAAKKKPKLNKTSLTLEEGSTATLKVKKNGKKISAVTWKSTKTKVAKVSKKGKVTAKSEGKATIKAIFKIKGAKKKTTLKCKVTVVKTDDVITGGWETAADPTITDEIDVYVSHAQEDGVTYEPIALLAKQVVAGINYRVLCKATPVVPDAKSYYSILEINIDTAGNLVNWRPWADTNGILEAFPDTSSAAPGAMTQTETPVIDPTMRGLYDGYMAEHNISYRPVALVGSQVTSGYALTFICERDIDMADGSDEILGYFLVTVNIDTANVVTIGDITPFTFGDTSLTMYKRCTDLDAHVVEAFAAKVRNTVAAHDWTALAGMIDFPINIMVAGGTEVTVNNAAEFADFITKYPVTDDFIKTVTEDSCVNMSSTSKGIMFGNGYVWMNDMNGTMKITSLIGIAG
ncbi:MAG: Ig-like domain-containing protein [Eubacterium sp.]|nr:Ig-like domain-containing protein [Eubacterium sp.]